MSQPDNNGKKGFFDELIPPADRNPKAILGSLGYISLLVMTMFTVVDQLTTHLFFVQWFAEQDNERDCAQEDDPKRCEDSENITWTWLTYRPYLFLLWAFALVFFVWPRIFPSKKKQEAANK